MRNEVLDWPQYQINDAKKGTIRGKETIDMRLICPNCSAQYEIDILLVPDEGRDVQCSNCGHTWFELPPPSEEFSDASDEVAEQVEATEDNRSVDAEPETDDSRNEGNDTDDAPDSGPSHAALAMAAAAEDSAEDDDFFEETPAPAPPQQQRRPADAAALEILKEEAERELSQRRAAPSEPMETQTDLGLDEIRKRKTPSRALRARMAHLNEDDDTSDQDDEWPLTERQKLASQAEVISQPDQDGPRRDLLPDIDEINSTLKSTRQRTEIGVNSGAEGQSGFRTGFLGMTILAIILIIAYAQAPAIARAVPGSESALIPYVDGANSVRDWIDGLMGKIAG